MQRIPASVTATVSSVNQTTKATELASRKYRGADEGPAKGDVAQSTKTVSTNTTSTDTCECRLGCGHGKTEVPTKVPRNVG